MNTQKQIVLIVALFFIFVGGCTAYTVIDLPYRAEIQTDWTQSESVERGALLFANNCRTCHGIRGEGGIGLPLNIDKFKDQEPLLLKANRDLLRTTIQCGRAGTLMPSWANTLGIYPNERAVGGSLNLRQIDHLVDLITSPIEPGLLDEEGNPSSKGWVEAVEFAHNLNHETNAIVGGDTLDSIAAGHNIGAPELAAANGVTDINARLAKGTKIQLLPSVTYPGGRTHEVKQDNETISRIAASSHAGAVILAELNKLSYRIDKKTGDFVLLGDRGQDVVGLFPGDKVAFPPSPVYVVKPTDTLGSVADAHGVTAASITSIPANAAILPASPTTDTELPAERTLALPAGTSAIVQPGDTLASIATAHKLKPVELAAAAGVDAAAVLPAGTKLKLPDNARFLVQTGDTYESVATIHGLALDVLLRANNIDGSVPLDGRVLLRLPAIEAYPVKGQSLADVAASYSNVTAKSLASANEAKAPGIAENSLIRIGTTLALPPDTWGATPPTTLNPGTACVQHAISTPAYEQITGTGAKPAEKPSTASRTVEIAANANDWTLTADGTAQEANKGVALVAKGSTIKFVNKVGLHTVTIGGKKDNGDLTAGSDRTITFGEAGSFKITCDYHPAMLATVFVE